MFHTENTRRPAVTVKLHLGKTTAYAANSILKDIHWKALGNGRTGSVSSQKTIKWLIDEVNVIAARHGQTKVIKGWESRIPKNVELAKDVVFLYSLERIRSKHHPESGTTAYIYILPANLIKNFEFKRDAQSKNYYFEATVNSKVDVPVYGDAPRKVYQFEDQMVRTFQEAETVRRRTGKEYTEIPVYVTEDGRYFPLSSEITRFEKVNLFAEGIYFETVQKRGKEKFGNLANVVEVANVKTKVIFNRELAKLEPGVYLAKNEKGDKVLVVDDIRDVFGSITRKYHLMKESEPQIQKLLKIQKLKAV